MNSMTPQWVDMPVLRVLTIELLPIFFLERYEERCSMLCGCLPTLLADERLTLVARRPAPAAAYSFLGV